MKKRDFRKRKTAFWPPLVLLLAIAIIFSIFYFINNGQASKNILYSPEDYDYLLNNQRIKSSVESNFLIGAGNFDQYRSLIYAKINDLEMNNTVSWDFYRHNDPWSVNEMREAYLQKVALSLYVEKNNVVPWSILSYSDEDLNLLLSDSYGLIPGFNYGSTDAIFNGNPTRPFRYIEETKSRYPNYEINTHRDLIYILTVRMRDDGWLHGFGKDYLDCDYTWFDGWIFIDYECMEREREGGAAITPRFIYSVLQANNVPSKQLAPFFGTRHVGIDFPSENIAMDGDAVYNSFFAGFLRRPNKIPVINSFIGHEIYYSEWGNALPCMASYLSDRKRAIDYLSLYNDPSWNEDVLALYGESGSYLRTKLKEQTIAYYCQQNDPNSEDYSQPPLTDEEIEDWIGRISLYLSCMNSSNASEGCGGGVSSIQNLECLDNLDNDADGKVDYPADPGCLNAEDNSEFNFPIANISNNSQPNLVNQNNLESAAAHSDETRTELWKCSNYGDCEAQIEPSVQTCDEDNCSRDLDTLTFENNDTSIIPFLGNFDINGENVTLWTVILIVTILIVIGLVIISREISFIRRTREIKRNVSADFNAR